MPRTFHRPICTLAACLFAVACDSKNNANHDDAVSLPPSAEQVAARQADPAKTPHLPADAPADTGDDTAKLTSDEQQKVTVETLRQIGDECIAKWATVQSVSSVFKTAYKNDNPKEFMDQSGKGTRDLRKVDGRNLVRTYLFLKLQGVNPHYYEGISDPKVTPQIFTAQRLQKVSDGQYVYVHRETADTENVTKYPAVPPHVQAFGGPALLTRLLRFKNLQQMDNEEFHGRPVYVLRGRSADGGKATFKIDTETGMLLSMEVDNRRAKKYHALWFEDVKYNVEFPPGHFEFQQPEGVPLQDQTQAQAAPTP